MTETADKYADLAKTAGASAGLTQEQIPGLAHILRELARSERAEQKEACARVADRYRELSCEAADKALERGDIDEQQEHAGDASIAKYIAAAIRARGS